MSIQVICDYTDFPFDYTDSLLQLHDFFGLDYSD